LGGVVVFLNTWFGARTGDRKSAQDALYAEAAKNLSNADASVRLNAVTTLDSFLHPPPQGWFRRDVNSLIGRGDENAGDETAGCDAATGAIEPAAVRGCEIVALLIGRLWDESDPAVLDAISDVSIEHATAGVKPLLSLNRSAAIGFAHAAGDFSATYILRMRRRTSMAEDADGYDDATEGSIRVIDAVTFRTGSPFEAKNLLNQRFSSRDFLEQKVCPFNETFALQQQLGLSSGFSTPLLAKPPDVAALRKSMERMVASAEMLEKSSYVLGRWRGMRRGWRR